jgi:hypothetical protein
MPRAAFYNRTVRCRPCWTRQWSRVRRVIDTHPTYRLRRIAALVRRELQAALNPKKVHRILNVNGW